MLLIQIIGLTWGKEERGAQFAAARQRFPTAYPLETVCMEGDTLVQCLDFYQIGTAFFTSEQEIRRSMECCLLKLGFTQKQIQQEIEGRVSHLKRKQLQFYHSTAELNLTNIAICPGPEGIEVSFFYDEHRSGMPYRQGHNKDYCNPKSSLYSKNCLNETAFILRHGQYGRIMWNERRADYDTGEWYYQLHICNLTHTIGDTWNENVFTRREPDFEYKQLAMLH